MKIKPFYKVFAALLMSVTMVGASANSVSLDAGNYDGTSGQITVTINYDFTDFAMFGGGMDLSYDSSVLTFVSYTRADLGDRPASQDPASPVGALAAPGSYEGFGVGTFDFFGGMQTAGIVGTFLFDVAAAAPTRAHVLTLGPNAINVMTGLTTGDVSAEVFSTGAFYTSTVVQPVVVPVPAAVWFMLSGVGALMGLRRRS